MSVTLKNNLPRLASQIERELSRLVRATAFQLEAKAKTLAPVDTGFLRNSIQTAMDGDLKAVVFTNAEYAPAQEYGTHTQSGTPFMRPAADAVRAQFAAAVRKLEGSLN